MDELRYLPFYYYYYFYHIRFLFLRHTFLLLYIAGIGISSRYDDPAYCIGWGVVFFLYQFGLVWFD